MADLNVALSDTSIVLGQADHPGLHTEERDYLETLRQWSRTVGGTSTLGDYGTVSLDSFAGADDDAKLTAALSATAADTYPRAIQLGNKAYTFATMNRLPFEGMKIMGPRGFGNPERGGDKMAGRVNLTGTGAWFAPTSQVFTVSMWNLAFVGGSNASVIGGTANWYCLHMRDIYSSGLKSLVGSQATAATLTACTFDGAWEINNCYDGAFHFKGSDNTFWPQGMLLDSGAPFVGSGQAHIWCDSMDKSTIGPLYITAEGDWCAIRHDGAAFGSSSTNQGIVYYSGIRVEGRNPGAYSDGSIFRMNGGIAHISQCSINYGMGNPTVVGHAAGDGVIHQVGGQLFVNQVTYDRATGVAETVPFVWWNGTGFCSVKQVAKASRGGAWTGKPRVSVPTAATADLDIDLSVTRVNRA